MSAYKVGTSSHWFYVMPFDVEMYVLKGYDLYKEIDVLVDDVDAEYDDILNKMTSSIPEYWAEKDGVQFRIQPFRMKAFRDRGYSIITKQLIKIDDPQSEIDLINASDAILPL